jgi:phospholipid-translocating ATPase
MKVYDFTSDRKMMSVIVKRVTDSKIFIFTKGADEKLTPLASSSQNQVDLHSLRDNVNNFAREGYRTLAFAMRELKYSY